MLLAILVSGVVAGAGITGAAAQAGVTSYTSQLTGEVIQTGGGYTIDMDSTGASEGVETVAVLGQFDGVLIAFMPAGIDLVMARDYMLGEYSSYFDNISAIDRGAYGNVSYSLDMASTSGIEAGMFSLFLGERPSGFVEYYLYFAPTSVFQQGFSSVQQNVTIGGKNIFDGVDGAGLQALLNQNIGITGGSTTGQSAPPLPTEAPVPTTEPAPTVASGGGGAGDSAAGEAYLASLQTEVDFLQTTLNDFIINFAALQDGNSDVAVSEINRVAKEWIGYPDRAATIVAPAGYEDIDASYRSMVTDVANLGNEWLLVVDALQSGNQGSIQPALESFIGVMNVVQTDIDTVQGQIDSAGSTAVAEVPTEAPAPTEEVIPTEVPTEVANTNTGGTSGGSKRPNISIGGKAGGNQTETGNGGETGQTADPGDYAALGLIGEGEYESPQFGTSVTWNDTWYFDDTYDNPIATDTESGLDSLTMTWADGPVTIFLTVTTADGVAPSDLADYWASDDYLADTASADAELLLQDTGRSGSAAVLTRDYLDDGTEVIIMRSANCGDANCDVLVLTTFIGLPDMYSDAYADARRGIDVNGDRLFDVFSPRNITSAIGA